MSSTPAVRLSLTWLTPKFRLPIWTVCIVFLTVYTPTSDAQTTTNSTGPNPGWRWAWECDNQAGLCKKTNQAVKPNNFTALYESCVLTCGKTGPIWPVPTGQVSISKELIVVQCNVTNSKPQRTGYSSAYHQYHDSSLTSDDSEDVSEDDHDYLSRAATELFLDNLPCNLNDLKQSRSFLREGNKPVKIKMNIETPTQVLKFNISESYELSLTTQNNGSSVDVTIQAKNRFGAKHAYTTLLQLIKCYKTTEGTWQVFPSNVIVKDAPKFMHRGVILNTGSNYLPEQHLMKAIRLLEQVKMNALHWRITDSKSFPMEVDKYMDLSRMGAYSSRQVYSKAVIKKVIEYGRSKGVRVFLEWDTPGHAHRQAWQFLEKKLKNETHLPGRLKPWLWCADAKDWSYYCKEPPCGIINVNTIDVMNIVMDIYREILRIAPGQNDLPHLGGYQVSTECWEVVGEKTLQAGEERFLWNYQNALLWNLRAEKLIEWPVIVWSASTGLLRNTSKPQAQIYSGSRLVIQVMTEEAAREGLKKDKNARFLMTHEKKWSLYGLTSRHIDYNEIYDYKIPADIERSFIGGELAIWNSKSGGEDLEQKTWPHISAIAERLWSNPNTTFDLAWGRFNVHRQALVSNHAALPDTLSPEWCLGNIDDCRIFNRYVSKDEL